MKISKKILSLLIISTISISVLGCSNTKGSKDTNDNMTQVESDYTKGKTYKIKDTKCEEAGITQTIDEVSVFNNMSEASKIYKDCKNLINDENKNKVTVVVKFKIENKNDFEISAYTSARPFVTNTDEIGQYIESGTYDTEIAPGEISEGYTIFNLSKTSIDELKSLKMWWIVAHSYGQSDDAEIVYKSYAKDNKFDIVLK